MATRLRARHHSTIAAAVLVFALVAAACSSSGSSGTSGGTNASSSPTTSGTPQRGGSVTWSLPAETSAGWCLPEGQLAISGEQIARAIYDTLTVPDVHEHYTGMLAQSVIPNATNTVWTIKLRPDIKFSDGSALTATVVKNNIDAYRGAYPARHPLLLLFFFDPPGHQYIKATKVIDPLTVEVDTVPWTAFPAYLYAGGRTGIMGQAQLDDTKTCASKLIGTGPFMLKDWKRNDHFTAVRNPNYWRKDKNGVQLPYLDSIKFEPIVDASQTLNGVQSGNVDLALDDASLNIVQYRQLAKDGKINLTESASHPELTYTLFNVTKPPFNNINARLAFAYAIDRNIENKLRNKDVPQLASGPFGPGVMGYLKDPGLPTYNPTKAKSYLAQYKKETGQSSLSFTFLSPATDPDSLKTIALLKTFLEKVGIKVTVHAVDESQGINDVIAKQFQAVAWRNNPGFDPDTEWIWWHCSNTTVPCDNPINFNGFNDPVINKALEDARASSSVAQRTADYEAINRQFAKQVYNGWGWWSDWAIAASLKVHGINNLPLPDGSAPYPGFTSGVDPAGVWVSKS